MTDRDREDAWSRRDFLRSGFWGGALFAAGGARAPVIAGERTTGSGSDMTTFELESRTILDLQEAMEEGTLSARSLTEWFLSRIEQVDRNGPALRAVIELNPHALRIADDLDRERIARGPRGPLHGIPILIKDNIDSADGMMTSAGSLALEGPAPARDAFVLKQLRRAGVVLLGKTNLSEWANFRDPYSTSGWSARGGQTRNPYALDRTPSGSSSGSAVAVAAHLCVAAVGSETDGSIVCPASANSVVGIKPTVGLVSRTGIVPISQSQDTAGPLARNLTDATILLGAMVGFDSNDRITERAKRRGRTDYTPFLRADRLEKMRVGVARDAFLGHPKIALLAVRALQTMKELGALLIDPIEIVPERRVSRAELEVFLFELKSGLNQYLKGRGGDIGVTSLSDIIAFNKANRDREMTYFGQEWFLRANEKGSLADPVYRKALEDSRRIARTEGIDRALGDYDLDAIVVPTSGPPGLTDLVNGDSYTGNNATLPAVAGYPHITVPMGYVFGLPVGLSFFSGPWKEPTLLKIAFAFEQAQKIRREPEYHATAPLPVV